MTETNTTKTAETPEPVKYGADVSDVLKTYKDVCDQAINDRDDAHRRIEKPINDIHAGLLALFGHYNDITYHVLGLVKELSQDNRRKAAQAATDVCQKRINAAEEAHDAALKQDPFTEYLITKVRRNGYESHVDKLLTILPATLDEMKALADEYDWCTDFERLCHAATQAEVVDFGTNEVTRRVYRDDVPDAYEPKEGESWEVVLQLPAYMRPHKYDTYDLIDYAESTDYRKVTGEGEQEDTDSPF